MAATAQVKRQILPLAASVRPRLVFGCKLIAPAILFVAIAGPTYQWLSSLRDAQQYRAPGILVDVNGHRMHIHCIGHGSPTVIFDAGLGDTSAAWGVVQPKVAKFTRVCSYDRVGLGWSEPRDEPRDSEHIAAELHALLVAAHEYPPFVLVGHSFGGFNQRIYAAHFPNDIVGMVLVDSSHPEQNYRFPSSAKLDGYLRRSDLRLLEIFFGISRAFGTCNDLFRFSGAVHDWTAIAQIEAALYCRVSTAITSTAELRLFTLSGREAQRAGNLGSMPLIVLSHDPRVGFGLPSPDAVRVEKLWEEMQEQIKGLSSNSRRIVALKSGHDVQAYRPELVVQAIRQVCDSVKTGKPVTSSTDNE
jgi:pimeloyl-ACP methyl ester carboxylesterase